MTTRTTYFTEQDVEWVLEMFARGGSGAIVVEVEYDAQVFSSPDRMSVDRIRELLDEQY